MKIRKRFSFLAICLVTLLTNYKLLSLYFGWYDFSTFYWLANKICPISWPFDSYCPVFQFLYSFLGYHAPPYYLLGMVLRGLLAFSVYLLAKRLVKNNLLALLTGLLVSAVGGEDSIIITYFISENIGNLTLVLTLLSLTYFNKKSYRPLILAFLTFTFSLLIFPIYSTAHVLLVLLFVIIYFWKQLKSRPILIFTVGILLVTLYTYIYRPYQLSGNPLLVWSTGGKRTINSAFIIEKTEFYLETTGSFFFTEWMEPAVPAKVRGVFVPQARLVIGILINSLFILFLVLNRKNKKVFFPGLLALGWTVSQYLPRGLVTNYGLGNLDRHFFYPWIGFAFGLNVFLSHKSKRWLVLPITLIILNVIQVNLYLEKQLELSRRRAGFYSQLRSSFQKVALPEGSIIYFDTPQGTVEQELGSYFRSGLVTEGAVALELGVRLETIKLVSASSVLYDLIKDKKFDPNHFFSFYYDGRVLTNTTQTTRMILEGSTKRIYQNLGLILTTEYEKNTRNIWMGINRSPSFTVSGLVPILPTVINLNVSANTLVFPVPFSMEEDVSQVGIDPNLENELKYLTLAREIKSLANVTVSGASEETKGENLIDNNFDTRWSFYRPDWFGGVKPVISINFSIPVALEGLVIHSDSETNFPTNFQISVDGKVVDQLSIQNYRNAMKLSFPRQNVSRLQMVILETRSDFPTIQELDFLPSGFGGVNIDLVEKLRQSPAGFIPTFLEAGRLNDYLKSGADACLEWDAGNYGKGQVGFVLYLDGKPRTYQIILPAMGTTKPTFRLGCMQYPVYAHLNFVNLNFLGNQ